MIEQSQAEAGGFVLLNPLDSATLVYITKIGDLEIEMPPLVPGESLRVKPPLAQPFITLEWIET